MTSKWTQFSLKDIARIITGKTPPGTEDRYFNGSTLFVTPTDMVDQKRITSTIRTLSVEGENIQRRYLFEKAIVVSCIGWQMGKSAIVEQLASANQQINVVIPDEEAVNFDYLYYVLKSKRDEIFNLGATATRTPILKKSLFEKIVFKAPSLTQQAIISTHLSAIDSKIELNHQINQTLEQIAQALFKSWFVDFDPVKAKIDVLEAGGSEEEALLTAMQVISSKNAEELAAFEMEKPEEYAELRATAELFPTAMVESELGEIPEGWGISRIEDLVQRLPVGKRYSQKTVSESGSVPVLDQGKSGIIGYHDEKPGVFASSDDPVIVFANHTCYMRMIMYDFSAIQNVLPFKGKAVNIYWLYFATLGRQSFVEYKGHWPDFVIKEVIVPDNILTVRFGEFVSRLLTKQYKNEVENQTLAGTRDSLLPKLLSGELLVERLGTAGHGG